MYPTQNEPRQASKTGDLSDRRCNSREEATTLYHKGTRRKRDQSVNSHQPTGSPTSHVLDKEEDHSLIKDYAESVTRAHAWPSRLKHGKRRMVVKHQPDDEDDSDNPKNMIAMSFDRKRVERFGEVGHC